jgi:hypothetical protein
MKVKYERRKKNNRNNMTRKADIMGGRGKWKGWKDIEKQDGGGGGGGGGEIYRPKIIHSYDIYPQ